VKFGTAIGLRLIRWCRGQRIHTNGNQATYNHKSADLIERRNKLHIDKGNDRARMPRLAYDAVSSTFGKPAPISPHRQALRCGIVDALMPRGASVNSIERPCMPSAPHILIVEDHAAVRELLTTIVARMYPTCTLTAVASGVEALAVYHARGADLVITDYAMPGMTGLALVQTLRAQQATIPILVISMNTAIAEVVLQAGANRFLPKPFSLTELQQILIDLFP
jgi:CheY-like chemotaxis protein